MATTNDARDDDDDDECDEWELYTTFGTGDVARDSTRGDDDERFG